MGSFLFGIKGKCIEESFSFVVLVRVGNHFYLFFLKRNQHEMLCFIEVRIKISIFINNLSKKLEVCLSRNARPIPNI